MRVNNHRVQYHGMHTNRNRKVCSLALVTGVQRTRRQRRESGGRVCGVRVVCAAQGGRGGAMLNESSSSSSGEEEDLYRVERTSAFLLSLLFLPLWVCFLLWIWVALSLPRHPLSLSLSLSPSHTPHIHIAVLSVSLSLSVFVFSPLSLCLCTCFCLCLSSLLCLCLCTCVSVSVCHSLPRCVRLSAPCLLTIEFRARSLPPTPHHTTESAPLQPFVDNSGECPSPLSVACVCVCVTVSVCLCLAVVAVSSPWLLWLCCT